MNLFSAIELFVKTVEAGSFSELGRQRHMAPSSISRQINKLEESLGVRLLQRSTRSINLTEAGTVYYDQVSKVLAQLGDAQNAISQLQAKPKGVLRISVAIPLGERIIVPLIPAFLANHPELSIDLILEDRASDLIEERIDMAIRIGRLEDSSMLARKLADNRFVVCASPQYLKTNGEPQKPEDLSTHNCVINKNVYNSNIWQFKKGKSIQDISVKGNLKANTGGALYNAMLGHLGIAALPTWYVGEDIRQGRLKLLLQEYELNLPAMTDSAIYALYPQGQYLPPKVRVFIDYLVENFSAGGVFKEV